MTSIGKTGIKLRATDIIEIKLQAVAVPLTDYPYQVSGHYYY